MVMPSFRLLQQGRWRRGRAGACRVACIQRSHVSASTHRTPRSSTRPRTATLRPPERLLPHLHRRLRRLALADVSLHRHPVGHAAVARVTDGGDGHLEWAEACTCFKGQAHCAVWSARPPSQRLLAAPATSASVAAAAAPRLPTPPPCVPHLAPEGRPIPAVHQQLSGDGPLLSQRGINVSQHHWIGVGARQEAVRPPHHRRLAVACEERRVAAEEWCGPAPGRQRIPWDGAS